MNRSAILALAITFLSVMIASGTDICDNSPCETQINASLGKEFAISLESNPSTGFEWWIKYDPNYLDLMNSTFVNGNGKSGFLGVQGTQMFTFNAKSAGNTEVIMLLLKPWKNGSIEERKIFPINIIPEASGPEQAKILGKGVKPERTTISKSSFQSSDGMDTNRIFDGQMNATAYETSSMDKSAMETPSQAITGYTPGPYDSSTLSQSRI
jgi:predicted secreted protein